MEKNGKIIELRDRNGGLIFSLYIVEKVLQDVPTRTMETPKGDRNNGGKPKENENPLAQDAFMTDAQKRYIFRILADQGKEGEEAHEYLKNHFQVKSLKEVTKLEASQAIDRLLRESKGGDEG